MKKAEKNKKDKRLQTSTAKFIGISAVIGVFILTFSYAYAWGEYQKQIEDRSGTEVFMTVNVKDFAGQPFTMEDVANTKLVAYNVWETTCPACLREMGDLEELSKEYDPSEFRLVGMCADLYDINGEVKPDQLETARELMNAAGVTFTNLVPDKAIMDFLRTTIAGYPTTFFVDSEGKVLSATAGARGLKDWEAYVNAELEKLN